MFTRQIQSQTDLRKRIKTALSGVVFLFSGYALSSVFAAEPPTPWTLSQAAPLEIGLVTENIDAMVPFYRDLLGFKFISDSKTAPEISTKTGATLSGYRIIRLQTPLGERVKLVQPGKNGPKPPATIYGMGRSGFQYLTFIVSDMNGTIARLNSAKTPLLSQGKPIETRPGVRSIFSRDPEGNFVEFVQFDDLKVYRPDYVKP